MQTKTKNVLKKAVALFLTLALVVPMLLPFSAAAFEPFYFPGGPTMGEPMIIPAQASGNSRSLPITLTGDTFFVNPADTTDPRHVAPAIAPVGSMHPDVWDVDNWMFSENPNGDWTDSTAFGLTLTTVTPVVGYTNRVNLTVTGTAVGGPRFYIRPNELVMQSGMAPTVLIVYIEIPDQGDVTVPGATATGSNRPYAMGPRIATGAEGPIHPNSDGYVPHTFYEGMFRNEGTAATNPLVATGNRHLYITLFHATFGPAAVTNDIANWVFVESIYTPGVGYAPNTALAGIITNTAQELGFTLQSAFRVSDTVVRLVLAEAAGDYPPTAASDFDNLVFFIEMDEAILFNTATPAVVIPPANINDVLQYVEVHVAPLLPGLEAEAIAPSRLIAGSTGHGAPALVAGQPGIGGSTIISVDLDPIADAWFINQLNNEIAVNWAHGAIADNPNSILNWQFAWSQGNVIAAGNLPGGYIAEEVGNSVARPAGQGPTGNLIPAGSLGSAWSAGVPLTSTTPVNIQTMVGAPAVAAADPLELVAVTLVPGTNTVLISLEGTVPAGYWYLHMRAVSTRSAALDTGGRTLQYTHRHTQHASVRIGAPGEAPVTPDLQSMDWEVFVPPAFDLGWENPDQFADPRTQIPFGFNPRNFIFVRLTLTGNTFAGASIVEDAENWAITTLQTAAHTNLVGDLDVDSIIIPETGLALYDIVRISDTVVILVFQDEDEHDTIIASTRFPFAGTHPHIAPAPATPGVDLTRSQSAHRLFIAVDEDALVAASTSHVDVLRGTGGYRLGIPFQTPAIPMSLEVVNRSLAAPQGPGAAPSVTIAAGIPALAPNVAVAQYANNFANHGPLQRVVLVEAVLYGGAIFTDEAEDVDSWRVNQNDVIVNGFDQTNAAATSRNLVLEEVTIDRVNTPHIALLTLRTPASQDVNLGGLLYSSFLQELAPVPNVYIRALPIAIEVPSTVVLVDGEDSAPIYNHPVGWYSHIGSPTATGFNLNASFLRLHGEAVVITPGGLLVTSAVTPEMFSTNPMLVGNDELTNPLYRVFDTDERFPEFVLTTGMPNNTNVNLRHVTVTLTGDDTFYADEVTDIDNWTINPWNNTTLVQGDRDISRPRAAFTDQHQAYGMTLTHVTMIDDQNVFLTLEGPAEDHENAVLSIVVDAWALTDGIAALEALVRVGPDLRPILRITSSNVETPPTTNEALVLAPGPQTVRLWIDNAWFNHDGSVIPQHWSSYRITSAVANAHREHLPGATNLPFDAAATGVEAGPALAVGSITPGNLDMIGTPGMVQGFRFVDIELNVPNNMGQYIALRPAVREATGATAMNTNADMVAGQILFPTVATGGEEFSRVPALDVGVANFSTEARSIDVDSVTTRFPVEYALIRIGTPGDNGGDDNGYYCDECNDAGCPECEPEWTPEEQAVIDEWNAAWDYDNETPENQAWIRSICPVRNPQGHADFNAVMAFFVEVYVAINERWRTPEEPRFDMLTAQAIGWGIFAGTVAYEDVFG